MLFKNREDAAKKLFVLLKEYKNRKDTIILALPRGGTVVANVIAKQLNLKLDVIVPRKIAAPLMEELAIGAICEDIKFLNEEIISTLQVSKDYIQKEIEKEKAIARKKLKLYRKNKPPINFKDKIIILIDDGIATGATMMAAILALKKKKPKKIVVVVPVAPTHVINEIKKEVEVICPYILDEFFAIAQYYISFDQVTDDEVIKILK